MEAAKDIKALLDSARAVMSVDLNQASAHCAQAVETAMATNNLAVEAEARHLLAQILFTQGKNIGAIEQIKAAIDIRESLGDRAKVSVSLNSRGIFLSEIGDYPSALESCFHSLRIKEELNDQRGIAATLINIGSIYERLKNREQERKMYERSLKIATDINDKRLITYNHLNLGLLYSQSERPEEALPYFKNIEAELQEFGDKANTIKALNNYGVAFLKMGRFEEALQKYNHCLQLARESGNVAGVMASLNNIGETMIRMGQSDKAKPYLDEALELAMQTQQKEYMYDAKLKLSEYYEEQDDFRNALHQYRDYVKIKDELLNAQNLKQLGELHLRYDLEKKEKEAEINQLKNVELKGALDKLQEEKKRSDTLLLNILPEEVAEELKATGVSKARHFESVTVMFTDIKNFTTISEQLTPEELVAEIDFLFRSFDEIITRYGVEKIKTIGDAYMCAAGIPVADTYNAENAAYAALEIVDFMRQLKELRQMQGKRFFEIRIGLNTGPVVAGIVGSSKFAYDIWGDTVNTAARMEQSGEVGKINISGSTYQLLKDKFMCTHRGKISAKNKGEIDMYFLNAKKQV